MPRSWLSLNEALESGHGSERPFNCPEHPDNTASASVNVDKGVWYCYACGANGKTQDGKHDLSYIKVMREGPIPTLPRLMLNYTNYYAPSAYWEARYGIDVAIAFDTGTDPITGMPTVPIFDPLGRTLHGFIKRNDGVIPDAPKYLYPFGVPVSRLLFNQHRIPATPDLLVLVEGSSDVMSLYRWDLPPRTAVAAVMGSGLHAAQAEVVARINPRHTLIAMDADDAGKLGAERSAAQLYERNVRAALYTWGRHGVIDPGELKEDPWPQISRTAEKSTPWSPPSPTPSSSPKRSSKKHASE